MVTRSRVLELRLTDNVAGKGLSNAAEEYPEYDS
jgi:hypothetical protein